MTKIDFKLEKIKERSSEIYIPVEKKISKKLPVFYNPVMKLNRDITIILLNQFPEKNLCDLLAGSGIRSIRFAKELKSTSITANDINPTAIKIIKKNQKLNKVKFTVTNQEANLFLNQQKGFDYIDIDPFGTPNQFLDSSIKKINRFGILAVTATDTSALCGTHPAACKRKYWATPKRDSIMKETALRILIRKIQLIGSQYEKALTPIFSYSDEHYFRVFLHCKKSKSEVDSILKKHEIFNNSGPLWTGALWDQKLTKKMYEFTKNNDLYNQDKILLKLLNTIKNESKINSLGFYDIHTLCKKNKIKQLPKKEGIINKIKKAKYKVSETHFSPTALRSNIPGKDLIKILKK
tara:strand:- start:5733 stop:6785 length:1053 start_codon:yes stop_codon:yes gene_type:complete